MYPKYKWSEKNKPEKQFEVQYHLNIKINTDDKFNSGFHLKDCCYIMLYYVMYFSLIFYSIDMVIKRNSMICDQSSLIFTFNYTHCLYKEHCM